ncbi:MAG: type I-U CRISPR-associated protein Cas7 [Methylomonas sp.]|nr:type I-U CRISPR-associated protein Cas7 [Methylomonas sp.]PPD19728.1 MAG: type I-U CRISPR-associated protein Cas7 [Methylomonas sp.]PPD25038.1 MAG: type I-U CRISPR-associated protein Cas7 [Methylomonas sp.]PPD39816.1 MAG: type I-U CRISPR-associated protein Cas7 [Methylomonas sp.]PPD51364.1 MAG: type I-U CRISPR-associated protein Cas7 [Methylomonas sp.]
MNPYQTLSHDIINQWADNPKGPVALILKQKLLPVDGEGGVIFPPTYADIGYSIDTLSDGTKVAQIDSVPSQANRSEPIFMEDDYKHLVPQIEINLGNKDDKERKVSILELAHRAGDAVVRSTDELAGEIDEAFKTLLRTHNAVPLAKLAPTSLIYGAWDSRGTQVKRPRLIRSIIRAADVEVLHTAAQYNSVWKLLDDDQKKTLTDEAKKQKVKLSVKGFNDVPAPKGLGGIIARGPITRQVTINLIALQSIRGDSAESTQNLKRYLLGLALIAATAETALYLREGCLLRCADEADAWEAVTRRGAPQYFSLSAAQELSLIKSYAEQAAVAFGVQQPEKTYQFSIKKAKELLAKKEEADSDAEG